MNQVSNKISISAKDPPMSVMKGYRHSPIDVTDKASKNPFVLEVNAYVSAQKNKDASKIRRALGRSNRDIQLRFLEWKNRAKTFLNLQSKESVEKLKGELKVEWGVEQVTEDDIKNFRIRNAKELQKYRNQLQLVGEENFQLMQQLYNLIYKTDRNGQLVDALPIHLDRFQDLDTEEWKINRIDTMQLSKLEIEESNNLRKDIETKLNQFWLN